MVKKLLFVFGTRPEVIKMAPIIELAKRAKKHFHPIVCVTAQHRHLLDQALSEFNIVPDIDLNLMKPNQSLEDIVSSVLCEMRKVYKKVKPDIVLVQGDTSTVLAASLAAFYENINVGHIEAGLRSGDNRNPFPEEINRKFVSVVATYHFCPTKNAKANLLKEGTDPKKIFITGNTIVDALESVLKDVRKNPPTIRGVEKKILKSPYVLITGHRRENFGKGMKNICQTIKKLAKKNSSINWIWAVHLNPNARKIVFKTLSKVKNIRLTAPLRYREFVHLMDRSRLIISDSGGVQEEAPSLGKKVFVTRICTERPEAVKSRTSILVGTDPAKISREVNKALKKKKTSIRTLNPFGDGKAAKRIIDIIQKGRSDEFCQKKK